MPDPTHMTDQPFGTPVPDKVVKRPGWLITLAGSIMCIGAVLNGDRTAASVFWLAIVIWEIHRIRG